MVMQGKKKHAYNILVRNP